MQTQQPASAQSQNKRARSRRNNNRERNTEGGASSRKTREFRNVFGDAIIEPEQIRETCIESAEQSFLAPADLLEQLQGDNRKPLSRQVRLHERVCEIDDRYGVLDFTLKSRSRNTKDIEHAYF